MEKYLDYAIIATALLTTLLILVQTRGASLGAGFGGSADINTVRRGSDASLHKMTIFFVCAFIAAILVRVTGVVK